MSVNAQMFVVSLKPLAGVVCCLSSSWSHRDETQVSVGQRPGEATVLQQERRLTG